MIRPLHATIRRLRRGQLGPDDAGRLMTLEDFQRTTEVPGFICELIDGVLNVSPAPLPAHQYWVRMVRQNLEGFAERYPARINFVTEDCEVIVPGRPGPTRPRPDVAAFSGFPKRAPKKWDDVCPVIVVEVISERRARKDTVRNRRFYWIAGGILEYWVLDTSIDEDAPDLLAHVRRPGATEWEVIVTRFGDTYRSPTIPGLRINLKRM